MYIASPGRLGVLLGIALIAVFAVLVMLGQMTVSAAAAAALALMLIGAALISVLLGQQPPREVANQSNTDTPLDAAETVVAAMPEPVIVLDRDGRIVMRNAQAELQLGGLPLGQRLSSTVRSPTLLDALRSVTESGQTVKVDYEQRVPFERRFETHIAPFGNAGSNSAPPEAVLLLFRDLTQQEKVERMRADFVAHASHELRTPLAAVLGFIETLQGAARNDSDARDRFLNLMQAQANRMSRLIEDLLSLSRIELNAHIRPAATVDLEQTVRHVIEYMAPLARDTGLEVRATYSEDPLKVQGDRDELVQVFQNLLENALKYAHTGGAVDISVAAASNEDADPVAEIAIRDYGPGIAREHLPRLTERFYRVDVTDSRARGGTGLGLAIVKHIVNRHRGRLLVDSTPDEGSTFTVQLPIEPAREDNARAA